MAAFYTGEERVANELPEIIRACPEPSARVFLCTQIADEARHAVFFSRFVAEVGVFSGSSEQSRLAGAREILPPTYVTLLEEILPRRVQDLSADPASPKALVSVITVYHMLIEGAVAVSALEGLAAANEHAGVLGGLTRGLRLVARDEHRHIAFGTRFLIDAIERIPDLRRTIISEVDACIAAVKGALDPPPALKGNDRATQAAARNKHLALSALERRLGYLGIASRDLTSFGSNTA